MDNRLYWIWLQQALGEGSPKAEPLLRVFHTPAAIWNTDESSLREIGLTESECRRLTNKSLDTAESILDKALKHNGWVLTPDDASYPEVLREIYALPLVLYGRGEWPDLNTVPALAMVGPRHPSAYGISMAGYIAGGMAAAGGIVVSGGALGIDAVSHESALEAGGRTVIVQGCGLDVDYPRENASLRKRAVAQGSAVISEYPSGSAPHGHHFPLRNRIISGLSWATCVVEAPAVSGSLITATHAREQGREVMAVPGPAGIEDYEGSNALLRKGACPVTGPVDVLSVYRDRFGDLLDMEKARAIPKPRFKPLEPVKRVGETPPEWTLVKEKRPLFPRKTRHTHPVSPSETVQVTCPEEVSEEGRRMFALLEDNPRAIDWLASQAGLSPAKAMAVLTELEIAGAARSHAGQQYSR